MKDFDRSQAPSPGTIRPFEFPTVVSERLSTGLELRIASQSGMPLVTAMAVLDAGETCVDLERAGLAVLAGDALEGGTEIRSGAALARALEGIGAGFGSATGWDSTTVAVSCLPEHLPEALGLLSEMIRLPAFPIEEFERYRSQRLATMGQRAMDPGSLAADHFSRWLYREGDAYGRPLGGTPEGIRDLSPDSVREFVAQRYGPNTAGLVIVGDIEVSEAVAQAEQAFGGWVRQAEAVDPVVATPRTLTKAAHLLPRAGAVQSEIRIGHVGVARGTEDHFPLMAFNMILGGSFTSRLNLNLRERNGFTYGVRSSFAQRRGPGPFSVSTAVDTSVTAAAVGEIMAEIEGLVADGPTEEEVSMARNYLAGVFPLRLETSGQIAARIAETLVYDLPDDYYQTYRDRIREIEVDEVAAAGQRNVRPEGMCTLIVGDTDAVVPEIADMDLGPVAHHKPTGGKP